MGRFNSTKDDLRSLKICLVKPLPNKIFRIRKPPFYPLNYGDRKKGKSKKDEGESPEIRDQKIEGKIQKSDFRGLKSRENKL